MSIKWQQWKGTSSMICTEMIRKSVLKWRKKETKGSKEQEEVNVCGNVFNYADTHTSTEVLWDTNRSTSTPTNVTTTL